LTPDRTNWSQLLRGLREESGLTQRALAHKTKMPQRTIAEYENIEAARHLSIYKVEVILGALGYEIDAFKRVEELDV
jgi:transcriptional regulator with XRE-family HTH domain